MRIYAHRGDHRCDPENTLAAFLAADAAGMDGIETDLRHTRDGVVILYHDHAVAGVPVAELTHSELVDLSGVDVPTLDGIAARDWRCAWNLEIKTDHAYALARDALTGWRGELLVSSFLHDVVVIAARETGRSCGALIAHRPERGMPPPPRGVETLVWDWKVVDAGSLRQAQIAGWTNAAYGAVSVDEHREAREFGLSMLITDHLGRRPE